MDISDNPSRGLFINACYSHVFSESNELWNSNSSPTLGNMVSYFRVNIYFAPNFTHLFVFIMK